MKKAVLFIGALIMAFSINAQQLTNNGFESWTGNVPQGWNTLGFMGFNLCDVNKTTDAHSGEFAITVAPAMLPSSLAAMMGMTEAFAIPGVLTNGMIDINVLMELMGDTAAFENMLSEEILTNILTDGMRLNEQPSEITGYYKFEQVENSYDMFGVAGLLYATIEGERRLVGMGFFSNEMKNSSSGYQSFSMPFEYIYEIPADELIVLALVVSDGTATDFSTLYLDDLNVVYNSGIEEAIFDNKVAVYPNPTSGDFKLNGADGSKVIISDVLGREVLNIEKYDGQSVTLSQKGVYFLNIEGKQTQKLIVK
ncbi:MAG: T9SS type A sorting domain-containing protein [Bacteroidales bacterium]|jgi:hypothetical protein|nr:T9SS type A sorting domain-containing protein [Bacteroidales bacterium]